jgi:hypothetical protein
VDALQLFHNYKSVIKSLVATCIYYGFDGKHNTFPDDNFHLSSTFIGYLLNFECNIPPSYCNLLIRFVKELTISLREAAFSIAPLVIWYDSIDITDGSLKYQLELNEFNEPFFKICDGSCYVW